MPARLSSINQNAPKVGVKCLMIFVRMATSMVWMAEKQQGFEFLVKVIIIQNLGEMTILLELVCGMVSFHISPIISQAKIADDIQGFSCLTLIFDNQSSLSENADLFRCSYGLLCVFHTLIK